MSSLKDAEGGSQPRQSIFFRLPREVRDQILFYVCGDKRVLISDILAHSHHSHPPKRVQRGDRVRFLFDKVRAVSFGNRERPIYYLKAPEFLCGLQVSLQFYAEATEMFYSSSLFYFDSITLFRIFLDQLPIRARNWVRELHLEIRAYEVERLRILLEWKRATHLAGLHKVCVRIEVPTVGRASFRRGLVDPSSHMTDLLITSSTSLPMLHRALISVVHRNARSTEEPYSKEGVDNLVARLAEGLR